MPRGRVREKHVGVDFFRTGEAKELYLEAGPQGHGQETQGGFLPALSPSKKHSTCGVAAEQRELAVSDGGALRRDGGLEADVPAADRVELAFDQDEGLALAGVGPGAVEGLKSKFPLVKIGVSGELMYLASRAGSSAGVRSVWRAVKATTRFWMSRMGIISRPRKRGRNEVSVSAAPSRTKKGRTGATHPRKTFSSAGGRRGRCHRVRPRRF